jgi:hypothetical protein
MDEDRLENAIEGLRVSSEARLQSLESEIRGMREFLERRTVSPVLFWGVVFVLALGVVIGWFTPLVTVEHIQVVKAVNP